MNSFLASKWSNSFHPEMHKMTCRMRTSDVPVKCQTCWSNITELLYRTTGVSEKRGNKKISPKIKKKDQ